MIAQWENECISLSVLSVARDQFVASAVYFERLSLADHACCLIHWARTTADSGKEQSSTHMKGFPLAHRNGEEFI